MTKQELLNQLTRLQQENELLKTHIPYGILNRSGLDIERRKVAAKVSHVIFGDIDNMHGLNIQYGYDTVNDMIKAALNLRHDDILLTGLWYSGDEILFIVNGDAKQVINRIQASFNESGMSITLAESTVKNDNFEDAVKKASVKVQAMKENHKR